MMTTQTPQDRAAQWQLWSDSQDIGEWASVPSIGNKMLPQPGPAWFTAEEALCTAWTKELFQRVLERLPAHQSRLKHVPIQWFEAMALQARGAPKSMWDLHRLLVGSHGKLLPQERVVWGEAFDKVLEAPSMGIGEYASYMDLLKRRVQLWLFEGYPIPPVERFSFTKTREKPRPSGRGWIARHRRFLSF